jgi:carboxymethylenebutenolidase
MWDGDWKQVDQDNSEGAGVTMDQSSEHAAKLPRPAGYLALPTTGKGDPVLVLHAWWGLNQMIRDFCRRLAEAGFIAFAPDLYGGKTAESIPDAQALRDALDSAKAKELVAIAAKWQYGRYGKKRKGLAVIGFSLGAHYALELSCAEPETVDLVTIFYGTGSADFSKSKSSYLGHFAETDQFEPQAEVDALKAKLTEAGRVVNFYTYPSTGHWFFEPDRADAYSPVAAEAAWRRTVEFLRRVKPAAVESEKAASIEEEKSQT